LSHEVSLVAYWRYGGREQDMRRIIAIAVVLIILLPISTVAAKRQKFVVLVAVFPYNKEFDTEIESYLKREIRELPDVQIVDKSEDQDHFLLSVVAAPISRNGVLELFALSYFFQRDGISMHYIIIGKREDLKSMCQQVIAVFDSKFVEPYRRN
jgi:hypothetical protein